MVFCKAHSRQGQSLLEVLVAVAVGAILFIGSASIIAPTLTINKKSQSAELGAGIGKELMDNVRVWAESDWHNVLNLATGTANTYYLLTSSSPFVATSGVESINISTTTYTRSFYLLDAFRDNNGIVTTTASGNNYDPSSKFVTVNYHWTNGVTSSLVTYLSRNHQNVTLQTDWSGGPGRNGPATTTNAQFSTSSLITYSTPGTLSATPVTNAWPNGYLYRRTITVSSTLVSPTNGTALSNFPMLISGTYSYLAASSSGGFLQNSNGYDFIFTSDASGTNKLNFERENYVSSSGGLNYWVEVPTLSSSSNLVYLFYDNSAISGDQSSASATWNGNYMAVYHTSSFNDSTGNNAAGSLSGIASTTGEIGNAGFFSAASSSEFQTNVSSTLGSSAVTMEAWEDSSTSSPAQAQYITLKDAFNNAWFMGFSAGGVFFMRGGASSPQITTPQPSINTWHFVTGVISGTNGALYIDGSPAAAGTIAALNDTNSRLAIGNSQVGNVPFQGPLDEIRISNVARSSDWIATEYNNENSPSTFYSLSSAQIYATNSGGTAISSSSYQHWAWNDMIGWIDFYNGNKGGVSSTNLTGYASSSVGDISLDCGTTRNGNICSSGNGNYTVLNDGFGNLSGWAWSDVYGWISFCGGESSANCPGTIPYQVTIDSGGNFQGWAWNDITGWIDFNCDNDGRCGTSNFDVVTTWRPPSNSASSTGYLDSTTFDTGVAAGAQFNSILWQGVSISGSSVQFQFMASNSSSGPWNSFVGPDGTANTYYTPTAAGTTAALGFSMFTNLRYFRYRVYITYANGTSSQVNDIVVGWSP